MCVCVCVCVCVCTGYWCPKNNSNYKSLLKNVINIFLKLADINNFYHRLWIILKIWILNLRSYCLFLDTPKLELKGIYGKHTAPSFENIILLITEIEYFTSSYQVRVVLMFLCAAFWLFNSLILLRIYYWPIINQTNLVEIITITKETLKND